MAERTVDRFFFDLSDYSLVSSFATKIREETASEFNDNVFTDELIRRYNSIRLFLQEENLVFVGSESVFR